MAWLVAATLILIYEFMGVIPVQDVEESDITGNIAYIQTGTTLLASQLYYNQDGFKIGDFNANLLGGRYQFVNGKHIGSANLMTYEGYPLPQYITTIQESTYGSTINEQKVAKYIQNFILLQTDLLKENFLGKPKVNLPQVNLIHTFKLECLDSTLLLMDNFCEYNLEKFTQYTYKYDILYDLTNFESLFERVQNLSGTLKGDLCKSIINYEMISGNPSTQFDIFITKCDLPIQQTHQSLLKRKEIEKELTTVLKPSLDENIMRSQFKLVSSMQLLQTQISDNKIDISFLNSYYEYVKNFLASSAIDQFSIDLIYKFHNQYLLKDLVGLQNIVNLDTVTDLQNIIEKLDRLNTESPMNGGISLKSRISPDMILSTDYSVEHPSLGSEELDAQNGNSQSGVDTTIISDLIGTIDNTIKDGLNSGEVVITDTGPVTQPNEIATHLDNQIPNTSNTNNTQDDLNTYQPQGVNMSYTPTNSDTDVQEKTIVSDRMYNNLGIKPDLILIKGNKYFVEWTYQWFTFSAFLDKNNNRKLSPIYVKIDDVRTLIPWFMLDLMDYDRYAQVKFLKNPEQYVRQATQ